MKENNPGNQPELAISSMDPQKSSLKSDDCTHVMVRALDNPDFMEITFIKNRRLTLLAKEHPGIKVIFPQKRNLKFLQKRPWILWKANNTNLPPLKSLSGKKYGQRPLSHLMTSSFPFPKARCLLRQKGIVQLSDVQARLGPAQPE